MPACRVILVRIFPHSDQNNSKYGHFLPSSKCKTSFSKLLKSYMSPKIITFKKIRRLDMLYKPVKIPSNIYSSSVSYC